MPSLGPPYRPGRPVGCPFWPSDIQPENAARNRGAQPARTLVQRADVVLLPGPEPQDREQEHDRGDHCGGEANQDGAHSPKRAPRGTDAITAQLDGAQTS
jgi:hypothetical protein